MGTAPALGPRVPTQDPWMGWAAGYLTKSPTGLFHMVWLGSLGRGARSSPAHTDPPGCFGRMRTGPQTWDTGVFVGS